MLTAPQLAMASSRMATASSVFLSRSQSCRPSAPRPNGFSRLSPGPVTNPSRDVDMSEMTRDMRFSFGSGGRTRRPARRGEPGLAGGDQLRVGTRPRTSVAAGATQRDGAGDLVDRDFQRPPAGPAPAMPADGADMQVTVAALVDPPAVRRAGDPVECVQEADLLGVVLGDERVGQRLDRRGLNSHGGGHCAVLPARSLAFTSSQRPTIRQPSEKSLDRSPAPSNPRVSNAPDPRVQQPRPACPTERTAEFNSTDRRV